MALKVGMVGSVSWHVQLNCGNERSQANVFSDLRWQTDLRESNETGFSSDLQFLIQRTHIWPYFPFELAHFSRLFWVLSPLSRLGKFELFLTQPGSEVLELRESAEIGLELLACSRAISILQGNKLEAHGNPVTLTQLVHLQYLRNQLCKRELFGAVPKPKGGLPSFSMTRDPCNGGSPFGSSQANLVPCFLSTARRCCRQSWATFSSHIPVFGVKQRMVVQTSWQTCSFCLQDLPRCMWTDPLAREASLREAKRTKCLQGPLQKGTAHVCFFDLFKHVRNRQLFNGPKPEGQGQVQKRPS